MVVVAVLAILAGIAVPAWMKESSQKKARSEVSTMFTEIANKEEQYMAENNAWVPTGALGASYSTGLCPAAPSSTGSADTTPCIQSGQPWYQLRVAVPTPLVYCSYNITTGDPTAWPPTLPAELASLTPAVALPAQAPASNWYIIDAVCDMDGNSTVNSVYYFSTFDSAIVGVNEGN